MPMYFFDVLERDGTVTHDLVGVELADADQALNAASRALLDVIQDSGMRHSELKVEVVVRDEHGEVLGRRDAELRTTNSPES